MGKEQMKNLLFLIYSIFSIPFNRSLKIRFLFKALIRKNFIRWVVHLYLLYGFAFGAYREMAKFLFGGNFGYVCPNYVAR
ncbi:hypothetical protein BWD42_20240 [Sphingobacterium sp. CZ-UAM]|jgi:hypothetical protein|nr:hypothetical protein BWD42_20240 [Sphingobacterium sp. CZ-UAM]